MIIYMYGAKCYNNCMEIIDRIRTRIDAATNAARAKFIGGEEGIELVLATKTVSKDILVALARYDNYIFGENRVQELMDKYFEQPGIAWHFIGQLQTNKVKYIIDKVELIHSVDRLSLAQEIDKQAKKIGKIANVLIEINIGNEAAKGGICPDDALSFVDNVGTFDNISVKGLMSVMPNVSETELRQYYLQLKKLYDTIKQQFPDKMRYLSAGMSGDYKIAVEYGANMLRLGSAIFGARSGGVL